MKRRRLFLSQPLLPTITETLEDLPAHPSQSTQGSQSLEDYMTSIQALARPAEAPGYGPVRLQRSPRMRQFSKAQMKLSVSASAPRGSPRSLRTFRHSSLNLNSPEDFSLKMSRERDSRGKDPVDWLFGQIRTWRVMLLLLWWWWKPCRYFGGVIEQGWRNLRRKYTAGFWLDKDIIIKQIMRKAKIYLFLCTTDSSLHVYMV